MSLADNLTTIAENVPKVYAAGKEDEWSDFWDAYQNKGRYISNLSYAFSYRVWTDANYNPKYTISTYFGENMLTYAANGLFYDTGITDTKVDINLKDCIRCNDVFRSPKIKTIRKVIVSETTLYNNWFLSASALENVTFEGVIGNNLSFADSPLLTEASLASIVEHLKDNSTTGTTKTITLNQASVDKLTEAQIAEIERKGWSLAV